jgi:hypothetical protein
MFSFGGDSRTCTDRPPANERALKREQRARGGKKEVGRSGHGQLSAVNASEPPVKIPTTTITGVLLSWGDIGEQSCYIIKTFGRASDDTAKIKQNTPFLL